MSSQKHLLLLNPWLFDFAAFDMWLKPMGLLYLAGHLRQQGYAVTLIDCLDRADPELLRFQGRTTPNNRMYGTGKFLRHPLPKPAALQHIPETYCQYGFPEELFVRKLKAVPLPAAILVTSIMTYWYPGVFRAIALAKQHFPGVPVVLGGIYARLCPTHAQAYSQADHILQAYQPDKIIEYINHLTGHSGDTPTEPPFSDRSLFDAYPAFDLYPHLDYACLLTSFGCPYRCTYCASHILAPQFVQRSPESVFQELLHDYEQLGVRHIAFYDDAVLVRFATHLAPVLRQVIEAKLACTFHTPNGLHARYITEEVARLLFQSGFKTIRLGLETIDPERQQQTGGKVTGEELAEAVANLKRAGFTDKQIGVYLFVGLPNQSLDDTRETVRYVHSLGTTAHLCEYSPIPGTLDWQAIESQGGVHADDDPVLHNNSIFIFQHNRYPFEQIQALKDWVRSLNAALFP